MGSVQHLVSRTGPWLAPCEYPEEGGCSEPLRGSAPCRELAACAQRGIGRVVSVDCAVPRQRGQDRGEFRAAQKMHAQKHFTLHGLFPCQDQKNAKPSTAAACVHAGRSSGSQVRLGAFPEGMLRAHAAWALVPVLQSAQQLHSGCGVSAYSVRCVLVCVLCLRVCVPVCVRVGYGVLTHE